MSEEKYFEDGYEITVRSVPTEITRKVKKPVGNMQGKKDSMTRDEWRNEVKEVQTKHILESDRQNGGNMSHEQASDMARDSVERCVKKGKL